MVDHNGVLVMQRLLLAGALGLSMAQKAAAILEGEPAGIRLPPGRKGWPSRIPSCARPPCCGRSWMPRTSAWGTSTTGPASERWCDALLHLLDLAAFATDLGAASGRAADVGAASGRAADTGAG